ncbi:hypothetical protein H4R99_003085 [Coemansia sp. RSA 1722]|nr:hypothetical protein IWW45_003497 [Coemansia sp. RSA 485]KAJ2601189.1 hypothetical protein H4R99_003085 [Coemansia sp. RSA 1722]
MKSHFNLTVTLAAATLLALIHSAETATTPQVTKPISDIAHYVFDDSSYTYCDPGYPTNSSYTAVPDAQLEFVQTIVRHGDRTPVHVIPNDENTWTCDGIDEHMYLHGAGQSESNNTGGFQQVIEIPGWNQKFGYANQVWRGSCDVGQLTDHGKLQHRTLGSYLRGIYVDKMGFLSESLERASEVYARTTYVWRTKNSAESLLGSLWPNRGISPKTSIPIHTYPSEIETMYGNSGACPRLKSIMTEITDSDTYQGFLEDQGPLMARLAGIFGVNNKSNGEWRDTWDGYFDILNARQCHAMQLPCSHTPETGKQATSNCATPADVLQASRNSHYEIALKYRDHPMAHNYTRLVIGSLWGSLKQQMEEHIAGKSDDLRFALYSGHDSTIVPLLASLKASNRNMLWPPYASNLLLELWKKTDGSRVVRVIYNGKVLELQDGNQWCDLGACPVDTFFGHIDKFIPTDITTECAA